MKRIILRIARLFLGLFLFAAGMVMTINANLGLSPWNVFDQGMAKTFGITMGQSNIYFGALLIIISSLFGERLGWGTLFNMIFIGLFVDILMLNHLIPTFSAFFPSLAMMLFGMFVIGIASFLYIGAGLGAGPRDSLMVSLTKKTNKSVRFIRNSIEISVLAVGYMLGGHIGIGTVITSVCMGYFVQFAFRICRFDVKKLEHRFIDQDIKFLKDIIVNSKKQNKDIDVV